ncbi:MAG: imidazole glycerol phosphate synthase subunit HisH [Eubacteriales bacterium]|nr:imidazole glycerol phosphate synthase subunit HisH [Eubacteriales bacterium]
MGYIGIVDYGAGNLMSVSKALDFLGLENKIVTSPELMENASGIILPGVGAFPDAMQALAESGLTESLIHAAKTRPFLGICLGAQMLFEESDEMHLTRGLGLLPGRVQRIDTDLKLPQIGWNSLEYHKNDPLMAGVPEGAYVYFVHTFKMCPADQNDLIATCDYNDEVTALVGRGQIYGSQFHPEKSGEVGMTILRNFGNMVGGAE